MKHTTKKKSNHTDLRIMAPRDSHAERERIEAKLHEYIKAGATQLEALAIRVAWHGVADTVSEICKSLDAFHEHMAALDIENILIEHVPLNQRWLLERWFSAIRATDEGIDVLAGMGPVDTACAPAASPIAR